MNVFDEFGGSRNGDGSVGIMSTVRGEPVCKLLGHGGPKGGPGADCVTYVHVYFDSTIIWRTAQIKPFSPNPSHSGTESVFLI